jgi:hypothetical protein
MGLFHLPENLDNPSIEDYLNCCIANIELYKTYPDAEYLIEGFALSHLQLAIDKMKKNKNIDNDT